MNKGSLILKDLPASIDSLETTAEGQLCGGFTVMGGTSASPMRANGLCANDPCENTGCGSSVGENINCVNTQCNESSDNRSCFNDACTNAPSGNTDNSVPSLGITSLF